MNTVNIRKKVRQNYYGIQKFLNDFSTDEKCEEFLFKIKYPNGYQCSNCGHRKFYKMKNKQTKRARILQCANKVCRNQESITANTVFHGTRTPLSKWFYAFFKMSQGKKGISALQLSKEINIDYSTTLLMMTKIRKEMEENLVKYQIGGCKSSVQVDEIFIGGVGREKQLALILLEQNEDGKLGRVRMVPIERKDYQTIERILVPIVKEGTTIFCDKNAVYVKLAKEYAKKFNIHPLAHWEENHSHEYLKDLNIVVSNLKRWYRGIHHSFQLKNTGYYLNEFCYRFNRRRIEFNIFQRLLTRSIIRPKKLHARQLSPYDMMAA